MKVKLTPTKLVFYIIAAVCVSMILFTLFLELKIPYDYIEENKLRLGTLHIMLNIIWILLTAGLAIWGFACCDSSESFSPFYRKDNKIEYEINSFTMKKGKIIFWSVFILAIFVLYNIIKPFITDSVAIYNKSVQYQNLYQQKNDEKLGFYDKLWKVYLQKNQIAELNKDVFIEVTKIIMQGRADGDQVAWKWVQENQQIPYAEFTKFYSDLSEFVFSQREAYFNIEKECMLIANQNNTMLDTFPNNIYNKILKCERIKFNYSFTSKKSKEVFASGEENIQ